MLCGSVFAIKGRQLWQRHQFQNSVDELISELKLVRNLSQTLRADITCELVPDQGGVHFYRRSDEPYLKKMERQVKPRIFLKRLHIAEPVTIQFSNQYWESSTSSIFITGEEKVMVYVNEERFATKHYVK